MNCVISDQDPRVVSSLPGGHSSPPDSLRSPLAALHDHQTSCTIHHRLPLHTWHLSLLQHAAETIDYYSETVAIRPCGFMGNILLPRHSFRHLSSPDIPALLLLPKESSFCIHNVSMYSSAPVPASSIPMNVLIPPSHITASNLQTHHPRAVPIPFSIVVPSSHFTLLFPSILDGATIPLDRAHHMLLQVQRSTMSDIRANL